MAYKEKLIGLGPELEIQSAGVSDIRKDTSLTSRQASAAGENMFLLLYGKGTMAFRFSIQGSNDFLHKGGQPHLASLPIWLPSTLLQHYPPAGK